MNRIQYIDCMRGLTMILVVYSHVILMSYGIDLNSFMNGIFLTFRMPLFFWVSGFLAYTYFDAEKLKKKTKKRITGQLLPTFVMLALFELYSSKTNFGAFLDNTKDGYWFTIVVFILFMLYSCLGYLLDRMNTKTVVKAILYAGLAIFLMLLFNRMPQVSLSNISQICSLPLVAFYAPYYCFGMLAKMYYDKYNGLITSTWAVSFCLVCYVLIYCIDGLPKMLCGFFAVIVINAIFHHYRTYFCEDTRVGKCLSYIGKNTISIYFLHYFVFRYMRLNSLATYMLDNDNQLLGGGNNSASFCNDNCVMPRY